MVSFNCHVCNDVVKKPKVMSHANSCGTSSYSCVDCMESFDLRSIQGHTSCMSEVAKYQGKYRCTSSGNPVKSAAAADSSDDEERNAQKKRQRDDLQKRRAAIMALSDSDSDEDWATAKPAAKKAKVERAKSSSPPLKPLVLPSPNLKAQQKQKAASTDRAAVATPKTLASSSKDGNREVRVSFSLGTANDAASILQNIVEEDGSLSLKEVAKELMSRYEVRISKAVRAAVTEVVEAHSNKLVKLAGEKLSAL